MDGKSRKTSDGVEPVATKSVTFHQEPCTFSGDLHGLVTCDQGQHQEMYCVVCGTSLPTYITMCYECQDAAAKVPYLGKTLAAFERSLIMEAKNGK